MTAVILAGIVALVIGVFLGRSTRSESGPEPFDLDRALAARARLERGGVPVTEATVRALAAGPAAEGREVTFVEEAQRTASQKESRASNLQARGQQVEAEAQEEAEELRTEADRVEQEGERSRRVLESQAESELEEAEDLSNFAGLATG